MENNIREDARENIENSNKNVKSEKMVRYMEQLLFLKRLLSEKLITEEEYKKIGQQLMSDYGVVSNLTV